MFEYAVFIGAAVNLFGSSFYIKETLQGDTKPNKVTWLMWSVAPLIATVAAISKGVGLAALPVFMSGLCPLLIFLASFVNPKAFWKIEKFDYLCGFFSLCALILWAITREPLVAIAFAIVSDGLAAVPTLVKSWKYPETETVVAYIAGLISASTAFLAIRN